MEKVINNFVHLLIGANFHIIIIDKKQKNQLIIIIEYGNPISFMAKGFIIKYHKIKCPSCFATSNIISFVLQYVAIFQAFISSKKGT